jgi:dipeptidyl aminopeptidase/acylaminoacyl peptidase
VELKSVIAMNREFKQSTAIAYVDVLKAVPQIAERLAVAGGSRG